VSGEAFGEFRQRAGDTAECEKPTAEVATEVEADHFQKATAYVLNLTSVPESMEHLYEQFARQALVAGRV